MRTFLQPRDRSPAPAMMLALVAAALLGACTEPVPPATGEAAGVARTAEAGPYPDLARVPPRPRLGYTVEQRREIVRGLVADREYARHEGAMLRHRLVGAPAPPPPAVPPPQPPAPEEPGPVTVEQAALEASARTESRSGNLSDFLDWLLAPAGSGTATDAPVEVPGDPAGAADPRGDGAGAQEEAATDGAAPAVAAVAPSRTEPAAPPRLFGVAGGPQAAPVASEPPAVVEFPLAGDTVPDGVRNRLRALVAGHAGGRILVVARGDGPAASLDRARRVAQELVALGVDPGRIELRQSGPGDLVRVEWRAGSGMPLQAGATVAGDPED